MQKIWKEIEEKIGPALSLAIVLIGFTIVLGMMIVLTAIR